jgi:hypothetical protein
MASVNAEKIFFREERQCRQSRYSACRFSGDLQKCLDEELAIDDECTYPDEDSRLPKKEGKNVQFLDVTIREYPLIVGDNIVSKGVPLTIAWESVSSVSINLDKYERARGDHRRKPIEMHMTYVHRENILRNLGFSRQDMDWGTKAATIARRERRETHANLHASRTHERLETLRKNVKNIMTLGRTKRKEREYLEMHVPLYDKTKMARLSKQTEKTSYDDF